MGDLTGPPAATIPADQAATSGRKGSKWAPASPGQPASASQWPALDVELAAAALELLLACSEAARPAQQGPRNSQQQLAAGVQSLMRALCSAQLPLTPEVCHLLTEAFSRNPELEAWATDSFMCKGHTSGLVAVLEEQGYGRDSAEPLLLRQRAS